MLDLADMPCQDNIFLLICMIALLHGYTLIDCC